MDQIKQTYQDITDNYLVEPTIEELPGAVQLDSQAAFQAQTYLSEAQRPTPPGTDSLQQSQQLCPSDPHFLDSIIQMQQNIVTHMPDNHPDKASYLNNYGNSLHQRFELRGNITDLAQAITTHQEAVRLTPNEHPNQAPSLNNLGNSLHSRYQRFGELEDLDNAIVYQQRAVDQAAGKVDQAAGKGDQAAFFNNLGNSFHRRFQHFGNFTDLERSISAQQQAVELTHDGHPSRGAYMNNLAISLQSQYSVQEMGLGTKPS
ncbi:hypothetical protein M422DRAFT_266552 [Sphaerobolus stellatus SS14]|uniref:Unplaced genomic scaffold SPHSTscaffold_162, whole genome shotgun sequence n=1 Tax=Sphaerobolus stellatus (strain SS14) TaxID=990650 RepID=A0A0C9TP40_SPHS4|nr:hypothetical protein M422DRAFT_266552 [Sphaerobolus stellatus SS14]